MTLIESTKNIWEKLDLLENLEDPEYLEQNGITAEDAAEFTKEITAEIEKEQERLQEFAEYIMKKRQYFAILSSGAEVEIESLKKSKTYYDNQVKKSEKTLEFILKAGKFEKLDTTLGRLELKKSDKMIVNPESIDALPKELIKLGLSGEVTEENKDSIAALGFEITKSNASLTEVKKWYKALSDEERNELKGKGIYIDDTATLKIK